MYENRQNILDAIKYIARADYKNNDIEDLEKAAFYLSYEIKQRKNSKEKIMNILVFVIMG